MRSIINVFLGLAAAVVIAGCGDSAKSETKPPAAAATADAAPVAGVPADLKAKGTLTVATDATYPPAEFTKPDGRTIIGLDPDLITAVAERMGLKVKIVNASFDSILPGLASGKYDIGMAAFTDTKEREKTVDFVTYFTAGTSFFVNADGGPTINTREDLCGHKVAVEKGTIQVDDATAQSKKCKTDGKPAVEILTFPDQNGANLALSSGRAEVGMADSPVAAYLAKKSDGRFKVVGHPYDTAPYGVAIPKGNGLAEPVLGAMKAAIADGEYGTILEKWGLSDGAIDAPAINAAK